MAHIHTGIEYPDLPVAVIKKKIFQVAFRDVKLLLQLLLKIRKPPV
jgi:hypothetical protein